MTNQSLEREVIELVATDRISIPIKSMAGKLDRARPKLAEVVLGNPEFNGNYFGERAYARVEYQDSMKSRGMRDAINVFSSAYPRYGAILNGLIEEQRASRDTNLYFGMNDGARITADDYKDVMASIGFSETESEKLYPKLMDISRKISRQRMEERNLIVG
jgi:hypothetical protein